MELELFCLVLVAGVFLVIFGLYEKILDSVLHFFKDIKKNFTFLFPILSGTLIGIFLLSKVLEFAFDNFFIITSYIFLGLILGSLPIVFKQANVKRINLLHIMCVILTLVFSIYLSLLENTQVYAASTFSNKYLILVGFFMSAGIVIPGVSKTAILIMMGAYSSYLSAISSLNLNILIPLIIGLICGGFIFMYLINFLFKSFKSYTYFLILGFVIGSTFLIFPGFNFSPQYIIGILISIICFFIAYKLGNLEKSKKHL